MLITPDLRWLNGGRVHDYEIFEMSMRREDLLKVPETELKFLLAGAKLLNEICILHRLLIIQHNDFGPPGAEREGRVATYMFFLLQLAGKLWEVWQSLQKLYFSAPWNAEHTSELTSEGKDGLSALKKAMSKGSALDAIRNRVAFHADAGFLLDELIATEPGRGFTATVSSDLLNTMYVFVEHLSVRAAARAVKPSASTQEGVDALFALVTSVAGNAIEFLNDAIALTMSRHNVSELPEAALLVKSCPNLDDMRLPFLLRPVRL